MLRRLFADEETALALAIAWTVGMLFFTLGGFYLGNIFSVPVPHNRDLQVPDMIESLKWAAIGAVLGIAFCTALTLLYPRFTRRDYDADMDHFHGGHGHAGHGHAGHGHGDDAEVQPHSAS